MNQNSRESRKTIEMQQLLAHMARRVKQAPKPVNRHPMVTASAAEIAEWNAKKELTRSKKN